MIAGAESYCEHAAHCCT